MYSIKNDFFKLKIKHIIIGWMQLIILIYNLTGASIKTSIANHVQILISAYLFLTGYGHFYYMWHRSDAGLTRYFQVKY